MKISFYRHLSTIASKPCLKTCSNFRLVEEVISEAQEATISRFLASILSRKRYEGNHWDDVIQQYKEIELSNYKVPTKVNDIVKQIEEKIVEMVGKHVTFLSPHAIELAEDGFIGPHVDSIKFSGGFIAGLSLQSPRILALSYHAEGATAEEQGAQLEALALREEDSAIYGSNCSVGPHGLSFEARDCAHQPIAAGKFNNRLLKQPTLSISSSSSSSSSSSNDGSDMLSALPELVEVVLPPRSLYLLSGPWRYHYAHAILGREQQPRLIDPLPSATARRSSLIFRDAKS